MNPINPADDDHTAPTYETAPIPSRAARVTAPIHDASAPMTAPTYETAPPYERAVVTSRAAALGAPIDAPDDMTAPTYEQSTLVVSRAARLGGRIAPLPAPLGNIRSGIANGANQRAARLGIGSALGNRAARLGLVTDPLDTGDQEKSA